VLATAILTHDAGRVTRVADLERTVGASPVGCTPMSGAPHVSRAPVVVVIAFFTIALVLVLIGAQRPSEPPPDVEIARAGTPGAPRAVTVIMRDYRFDPTPIVLVPGETVSLTVLNGGLVEHELTLGDEAVQTAWSAADAAATPPAPFATPPPAQVPPGTGGLRVLLGSGEEATVIYTVPTTGALALLCHLPGHVERGMVGAVELRDLPGAEASGLTLPRSSATL
jgi:uncharacterized cupredoxin-like copper-binding protein